MKKLIFPITIFSLIISCEKKTEIIPNVEADSTGVFKDEKNVTDSTLATNTGCYFFSDGRDSAFVKIDDNLGTVTGKLTYKIYGKPLQTGDIIGTSTGDTIKTDYHFSQKDQTDSKEIWFLKKNGNLLESTNNEAITDKTVKFSEERSFKKVDCKQIEQELK
ncbi:MAG: hypothetical protein Q4G16_11225 [Cruoricaptor ignavus]|nr:hypothetical protein [Cruoricaptor ignavus]